MCRTCWAGRALSSCSGLSADDTHHASGRGRCGLGGSHHTIVTARHILYSVTLAPRFQVQPRWFRCGALCIDRSGLCADAGAGLVGRYGLQALLPCGWFYVLVYGRCHGLGIILAPIIPASIGIEIAITLMFLGLLLAAIKRKSQVVTAVSAGIALWFAHLDNQVGLIIALLVSLVVATINEWRAA